MTVDQRGLVSPELLLALVAGEGWEQSRTWMELVELVSLPGEGAGQRSVPALAVLEEFGSAPGPGTARRLSESLQSRAESEPEFFDGLVAWRDGLEEPRSRHINMINGGTFNGNVVQGGVSAGNVHLFTWDTGNGS
ncbi:hypothetical protein ACWCYY_03445 [Kitasatospora sp. NPDC001664]